MTTISFTPGATGRRDERDGTAYVVFERTFKAPIADVWAAVTESDRLSRWIGRWSGDPASGSVTFFMTAEAEDAPAETIWIDECVEPNRLVMRSARPDDHSEVWSRQVDLAERGGVTTLTFAREIVNVELAQSVGPGWDYYLDRMVAAETGGDPAAIDFDDYYPAFAAYYRDELS
ncbi:SRPBCC family protein [Nocardioides sp. B-3]|uniref:SRPBCC family protein n=1 Tax=Nocardioides sp. B-3 TaxID=2895565 RepID=UPI0021535B05|nr:SRPBCC family protein [Nocardioides sp. B-3]UUZ60271.1 SRPBCC family protein [Nocardioides sp. B-3]